MKKSCRNGNCIAYKNNTCKKATRHKRNVLEQREKSIYVTDRYNKDKCGVFEKIIEL